MYHSCKIKNVTFSLMLAHNALSVKFRGIAKCLVTDVADIEWCMWVFNLRPGS